MSFLQGQLSNDMQPARAGRNVLAACSTAQGRVLALLQVFARGDEVLAVLPRELVTDLLGHLRKYVLRAKVQLDDASNELPVGGSLGARALSNAGVTPPPPGACVQDGELTISAIAGDDSRFWVLGSSTALAQRLDWQDAQPLLERHWRWLDVQAGLPQVYAATREAFVAQMLNLDLLQGISFTKGCYTGQEIIARTQHLGRIKRRLFRVDLPPGDYHPGQSIALTDGRSGRLTEVAVYDGRTAALAVLNLEPGEAGSREAPELIDARATLPDYFPAEDR